MALGRWEAINIEGKVQVNRKNRPSNLHKIRLIVRDIQHSLEFYQTFLGLRLAWIEDNDERQPLAACLEIRDTELVLVERKAWQENMDTERQCIGILLCLEVANIGKWFIQAQQQGYTPLHPVTLEAVQAPQTQPWGESSFILLDPDRYNVQLGELL